MKDNSFYEEKILIPPPPSFPLDRVLREDVAHFCPICHSTMSRKGFMRLFGKRTCDNTQCKNS